MVLTFRHDVSELPAAREPSETAFRALGRPEARRFSDSLMRNIFRASVHSPGGIYLGDAIAYNVNMKRMAQVLRRIVKGLYYHATKARLPDGYGAAGGYDNGNFKGDVNVLRKIESTSASMQAKPPNILGNDVLRYWFQHTEQDPHTTFWLLIFFGHVRFYGATGPKALLPGAA
jgi:hypothetical protein